MSVPWYDRNGNVIPGTEAEASSAEWRRAMAAVEALLTDPKYKILANTQVKDYEVSTVWLGLSHSFNDHTWDSEAKPYIFETMVFGEPDPGVQVRYQTEEEAFRGHWAIVGYLEDKLTTDMLPRAVAGELTTGDET